MTVIAMNRLNVFSVNGSIVGYVIVYCLTLILYHQESTSHDADYR